MKLIEPKILARKIEAFRKRYKFYRHDIDLADWELSFFSGYGTPYSYREFKCHSKIRKDWEKLQDEVDELSQKAKKIVLEK